MIAFPLAAPTRTEAGWSVTAELTAECAFLRGHFPGRPILPAVAQLALVTQAASAAFDRELWPSGVRDVRFQRPLVPDCAIEVRLSAELTDGELRFTVLTEGKPVSRGALALAAREDAPSEARSAREPGASGAVTRAEGVGSGAVAKDGDRDPGAVGADEDRGPDAEGAREFVRSDAAGRTADPTLRVHLPQVGEARYVGGVVEASEEEIACVARIPDGNAFRSPAGSNEVVPAFLGLEIGAQAAAAHEGVLREREGGEAQAVGGYVVRCRDARFRELALPAGAELVVRARLTESAPPLRTYAIEVGDGAVTGAVSTFAR